MKNFWLTLPKPFLVQAPMEQVTDVVFREMLVKVGKPDVFFTEFTSTDGMLSQGADKVMQRLEYLPSQRPIVAQIWGNNPQFYIQVATMLRHMGFDGIDINMGCPDKAIVSKGCCSGLIKNHALAAEIIAATKEGAGDLPVSVKTRLGFYTLETEQWLGFLLEQNITALTVHGRTVKEMSKVPARWEEIGKVVSLRNQMKKQTLIVGNGDVQSREEAVQKAQTYGVDGVMIGRGIFHNLWVFHPEKDKLAVPLEERIQLLVEHLTAYQQKWQGARQFEIMKKFYKVYLSDFPGASEVRSQAVQCKTPEETIEFLRQVPVVES